MGNALRAVRPWGHHRLNDLHGSIWHRGQGVGESGLPKHNRSESGEGAARNVPCPRPGAVATPPGNWPRRSPESAPGCPWRSPSGPAPRQPRPENTIARPHVQPSGRSLLHPELMPERSDLQTQGRTRPDRSHRTCAPGTQDGRHNVGILTSKRGLLKADSVMQIVGKINRDADHEHSGTTGSLDALPRPC